MRTPFSRKRKTRKFGHLKKKKKEVKVKKKCLSRESNAGQCVSRESNAGPIDGNDGFYH